MEHQHDPQEVDPVEFLALRLLDHLRDALEQVSEHLSDSGRLVEQDSTAVSLARIELGERIAALSPIETDTLRVLLVRAGVDLLV